MTDDEKDGIELFRKLWAAFCDDDNEIHSAPMTNPAPPDVLAKLRTNSKNRPEGMIFLDFLSSLAIGMTAIRDSWPEEWKKEGLYMREDGILMLNGAPWVPVQADITASDWQVGD
jgi:hypothetical protein